jgi:uncharacterized protein with PQ loop repeat
MNVQEIFGWLGGSAGAILLYPQVWRIWKNRQHSGLSVQSNTISSLYSFGWVVYGISIASPSVVITNLNALLGMLLILVGNVWFARPPLRRWLPVLAVGLGILTGTRVVFGVEAMGSIVATGAIISISTQVLHLVQQRRRCDYDVRGISRLRWSLGVFCNCMWAIYAVIGWNIVMLVPAAVNAVLSVIVLLLSVPSKESRVADVKRTPALSVTEGEALR